MVRITQTLYRSSGAAQLSGKPLGGSRAEGWLALKPSFLVLMPSDAVPLRKNESRVGWKPVVLKVIPVNAGAPQSIPKPVVLGVVPVNVVPPTAGAHGGVKAGDSCLPLAFYGRARPTRRCS